MEQAARTEELEGLIQIIDIAAHNEATEAVKKHHLTQQPSDSEERRSIHSITFKSGKKGMLNKALLEPTFINMEV